MAQSRLTMAISPTNDTERRVLLATAERHLAEADEHIVRVRAVIAARTGNNFDPSDDQATLARFLEERLVIEREVALLRAQSR
jgi:hypothetical protein